MRFVATVRDGEVVGMRLVLKVLPVDPSWPYRTLVQGLLPFGRPCLVDVHERLT